jgi:hypothetical protein
MLLDVNRNKPINDVLLGEEVACLYESILKDDHMTIELITKSSSKKLFSGSFTGELRFSFCSVELTTSLLKFSFLDLNKIEYFKINTAAPLSLKTKIVDISCGFLYLEIILENICNDPILLSTILTFQSEKIIVDKFSLSDFLYPQKRFHKIIPISIFHNINEGKISMEYSANGKSQGRLQTILKDLVHYEEGILFFPKNVKGSLFTCLNSSKHIIKNVEIDTDLPNNYFYFERICPGESVDVQMNQIMNKNIRAFLSYIIENQVTYSKFFFTV